MKSLYTEAPETEGVIVENIIHTTISTSLICFRGEEQRVSRTTQELEGERQIDPEKLQDRLPHEERKGANETPGEDLLQCVVLVLEGCAYALVPRLALSESDSGFCLPCAQEWTGGGGGCSKYVC